jgi:hypothetical protein
MAAIKRAPKSPSKAESKTNPDKNNWNRSQCWSLREMLGNDDSSRMAHIERLVTSQQPWKSASGDAADYVRLDPSEPETLLDYLPTVSLTEQLSQQRLTLPATRPELCHWAVRHREDLLQRLAHQATHLPTIYPIDSLRALSLAEKISQQ